MKNVKLEIEGLNDPETQERVKDQLVHMIGVYSVELSQDEKYMEVNYDSDMAQSEIFSHLQNNGYKINQ